MCSASTCPKKSCPSPTCRPSLPLSFCGRIRSSPSTEPARAGGHRSDAGCREGSVPAVSGDDALGELLTAGARLGIEALFGCMIGQRSQGEFAAVDAPSELTAPGPVALLAQALQVALAHDVGRRQQRTREGIYAADMGQIQVRRVHRLAA